MIGIFIGVFLFAALGGVWVLRQLIFWVRGFPVWQRGHAVTALVWSVITFCVGVSLLLDNLPATHLVPPIVLYVAGTAMIWSWGALLGRSDNVVRGWSNLPRRLLTQSLWGPLALWIGISGVYQVANLALWNAIDRRDLTQIHLLGTYGFQLNSWDEDSSSIENYWRIRAEFDESITNGDISGVSACLEAAPFLLDDVLSESRRSNVTKNLLVLRLILDYYKETGRRPELIRAVIGNNVEAAKLLIWNGADTNAEVYFKDDTRSLLWVARNQQELNHWDKSMIRLLKSAGAKE